CQFGFFGENCNITCSSHCTLGCQPTSGLCILGCKSGWQGVTCEQRCQNFKFGSNCQRSCGHCDQDQPCDAESGVCTNGCVRGWTGARCDEACQPYTYGVDCQDECGQCRLGKACNMVTGVCSGGCKSGWRGEQCDSVCADHRYGVSCAMRCGQCQDEAVCHHITGMCPSGCGPGWIGLRCNQKCPVGRYGINCSSVCGQCENGTCDHVSGICQYGCTPGWRTQHCNQECDIGRHGRTCVLHCGHCIGTPCDISSGICLQGCQPGWRGIYCKQACEPGFYGPDCHHKCGKCKDGLSCDLKNGRCQDCERGWTGHFCSEESNERAPNLVRTIVVPVLSVCIIGLILALSVTVFYFIFIRPRRLGLFSRFYRLNSRPIDDPENHIYEQIQSGPWELNRYNLVLTNERLGHGHFGQVRKGFVKTDRGHQVPVAVKSLKGSASEKDKNDFMNELNILKKVGQHTNIVCLVGACHIQATLYVAMEYAQNGDLRSYLRKSRRKKQTIYANANAFTPLSQAALLKFAFDAASGLSHLANKQIIHRDVAARNVLLDENLIAKVADFGLSKNDDTYIKTSNVSISLVLSQNRSYCNGLGYKWSFGVMLWEIATLGGTPYHGFDTQQLCNLLKQGNRLRRPRNCEQVLYAMMLQCWNERSECRPGFPELCLRLQRMLEDSQVYMNINYNDDMNYAEIDHKEDE
ncbi:hypothetical protein ScPMuIL_000451, partial [Solemya velum]